MTVEGSKSDCRPMMNEAAASDNTDGHMSVIAAGHDSGHTNVLTVQLEDTDYLQVLLEGMDVAGDTNVPMDVRPDWLDMEKFRRGQRFATKHLFGLVFAEMLSLMMLFSFPDALQPIIFSENSDTPFKAFKRYLSTVCRVKSWYEGDPWQEGDEAHRNMKVVRALHSGYRRQLKNGDPCEIGPRLTLGPQPVWADLQTELAEDFLAESSAPDPDQCPYMGRGGIPTINQMDMAVTQFGFVALIVLYPASFGAGGASDADLDAFVHLWRGLGFLLGIDDRYNVCGGDLVTVRRRCGDLIQRWVRPNWRSVGTDWEHMLRCVVEGISYYIPMLQFEVCLLYLCRVLGMRMPRLAAALTMWQRLVYGLVVLVMSVLLRMPWYLAFSNWLLQRSIRRAQKASPEWLKRLEGKVYPYQQAPVCTRL